MGEKSLKKMLDDNVNRFMFSLNITKCLTTYNANLLKLWNNLFEFSLTHFRSSSQRTENNNNNKRIEEEKSLVMVTLSFANLFL